MKSVRVSPSVEQLHSKTLANQVRVVKRQPPCGIKSATTEMVIMADRRREVYAPSKILRAESARQAAPPAQEVDPVAEALQLIRADMLAQASSDASGSSRTAKEPVTIRLSAPTVAPDVPLSPRRHRHRSPTPPPEPGDQSIFPDDIENYRLRVRRGGIWRSITDRFGELLQRQAVVQQLQRQLRLQTATMRAEARHEEAAADEERRRRFGEVGEPASPPPTRVPPTTAADTLLVLREHGSCGPADLCLQPPDLPRALSLIHRLRCEVLELRACSLRATCEKNEVAAQLNRERSQLRRTFTSAQVERLTGNKVRGRWGAEDVRRAIAARRVLTRRQYRYLTEVMHVPLPSLKLRNTAIKTSTETKRLYEQLVAEKVLAHMTKKRRVNRPVRKPSAAAAAAAEQVDSLIMVDTIYSESEDEGRMKFQA